MRARAAVLLAQAVPALHNGDAALVAELQGCASELLAADQHGDALCIAESAATLAATTPLAAPALIALQQQFESDSPLATLPALEYAGWLRVCRGLEPLSRPPLFAPQFVESNSDLATTAGPADESITRLPRIFSTAMTQLADAASRPKAYKYLGNIALQLLQFCKATAAAELWSAALAMVEVRMHADAPGNAATDNIYAQLKAAADELVDGRAGAPSRDLMCDILFYVALGGAGSKHTERVRSQFSLDAVTGADTSAALDAHIKALLPVISAPDEVLAAPVVESVATPAPAAETEPAPADESDADPMIVEIFLEEAGELVESLEESLERWIGSEEPAALEEIQRHMHTMKGGARMASQTALGDLSHEAETYVIDLGASGQSPAAVEGELRHYLDRLSAGVQALSDGTNVAAAMAAVSGPGDVPSVVPEAAETAPQPPPVADTPAPQPTAVAPENDEPAGEEDNADPVIVEIFLEEADELLESLDASLTEWQSSGSEDVLGEIQRQMHTVKGGARMASQTSLGNVAHEAETYSLEALKRGESPDAVAPRLRLYIDQLSAGISALKAGENVAAGIAAFADADTVPVKSAAPAPTPTPEPEAEVSKPAPAVQRKPPVAPKAPAQEESLRVPASLLDALTNLSGEAGVARNRVGQQISQLSDIGDEMRYSTDRLRDAVRYMSGDVEALEGTIADLGDANTEQLRRLQRRLIDQKQLSLALREATEDLIQLRAQLLESATDAEQQLEQQTRTDQELQAGLLRARTVPFSRSEARLHRIVRQVSNELGKPVQLLLQNAEGELDRRMLERIIAPLEHMLRNAVDHGVEPPDQRRAAGKPEQGLIKVAFEREGGEIVISIADDGGGIKVDAVRNKAIEQGLLAPDAALEDRQILQYLLKPGFSTASAVTQISGRGVGMDVVNSEILQLGGHLEVDTRAGKGSTFSMRLPFTLSSNKVLMVRLEEGYYAVAMHALDAVVPVSPTELAHQYNQASPVIQRGDVDYELYYLGDLVASQAPPYLDGRSDQIQILLMSDGRRNIALHVDSVENAAELTVKTLGAPFAQVPGLVGASVRGDGNVAVILDVFQLLDRFESGSGERSVSALNLESVVADLAVTVLLVDDSLSARAHTAGMLRDHGLQVVEKRDGVDAMNWLQTTSRLPQLLITEIALPRMDGYELLTQVGRDERCKGMPLMVISRYLNDESRDRARSQGAGAYMTKPADPAAVLKAISQMTGAVIQELDSGA